ncbi:MAG: transposase [Deltaproteobacteria bacterium]|nr:transposase [Deltaproteobacteria bacterium]
MPFATKLWPSLFLPSFCETACADAGYANTGELKKIDDQGIAVIVPATKQAHNRKPKPFSKERFSYSAEFDCYVCAGGRTLTYYTYCHTKRHRIYQIKDRSPCLARVRFGLCARSWSGRRIRRLENEAAAEKISRGYELPESRRIYALRKQKVELPFGHIKRNLGAGSFLLRGIEGARAEMALPSSCFHIKDDNNRGRCRASYETDGLRAAPQGAKRAHNQRIYMSGIE